MKIGERLIKVNLITIEQLNRALAYQKELNKHKKIIRILVDLGFLTEKALLDFFVEQCKNGVLKLEEIIADFPSSQEELLKNSAKITGFEFIDLIDHKLDIKVAQMVPFIQIEKFLAIPFKEDITHIWVAIINPFDIMMFETYKRLIKKKPIKFVISPKERIVEFLNFLRINESVREIIERVRKELRISTQEGLIDGNETSAIMKLINAIFEHAINIKSSDIHIESNEDNCIVRCRVDGILQESFLFDLDIFPPLSSRIKLLANLDIAEKRKPQDGRFSTKIANKEYDFRVSSLPIITGESIVVRILDKAKVFVKLEELGMSQTNLNRFNKIIHYPYGIIFVTGPTGSGKTTTLYAALNKIKSVGKKIISIEDPVEYQIKLIHQVMINEKAGLTFPVALRAILRQDPDIIMVGEIRDQETMKIAIQAALTGHLVLSTLHTNDAISAISRLVDMGIEPFFVASAMCGIEAQRLVRRLCQNCKYEVELAKYVVDEIEPYLPKNYRFFKSRGCHICNQTGYVGRELISEVLIATEGIKRLIIDEANKEDILKEARKDGFITMFEDGINKVINGLTSIEEVYRVAKLP